MRFFVLVLGWTVDGVATVIAGAAAAYNLEVFAYYVMNAFNQTATTFVGQNYGAGQADRCKRTFALCLMEGYVLTAVACIAILYFSQPLIALFNPDSGISMLSAVIAVFWVHPAKNFARSHERKHFLVRKSVDFSIFSNLKMRFLL